MASNLFRVNRGLSLSPQASVPASPVNGDIYYDSTFGSFVFYNNGNWINLASRSDVATAANLTSTQLPSTVTQSFLIRLTGSTASNLNGMAASSDAKQITVYNQSTVTVTIRAQNVTEPTAANRIITPSGSDVLLLTGQSAIFVYDSAQARWILTSVFSTGSASNNVYNNNSSGSVVIATGTSYFNPYLDILVADTYTVNSGSELVSVTNLTVDGTLTVLGTGEVRVI